MFKIPVGTPVQPVFAVVDYGTDGESLPLPEGTTLEVVNDQPDICAIEATLDLATRQITGTATIEDTEIVDGKADVASGHLRVTTPSGDESILAYQVAATSKPTLRISGLKIGDYQDE